MIRNILIVLILGATAAATFTIEREQKMAGKAKAEVTIIDVPARIGSYEQMEEDIEVADNVRRLLQTSLILMRNYRSAQGWPIQLTIVYSGANRRSLHFPEVCLVGAGWEIQSQETGPVGFQFNAKRLVLIRGDQQQAVLYWFKTGDKLTGNFFLNSFYWAKNQLAFGSPTSAMVKVAAPLAGQDPELVFSILEDFASKLTPVLMENVS